MSFSDQVINRVWKKGIIDSNNDSNVYRKDVCGAWILKSAYGNTNSKYGWQVDHIKPTDIEVNDELSNLQPLHWRNNQSKGNTYPSKRYCIVQSNGIKNIDLETNKELQ